MTPRCFALVTRYRLRVRGLCQIETLLSVRISASDDRRLPRGIKSLLPLDSDSFHQDKYVMLVDAAARRIITTRARDRALRPAIPPNWSRPVSSRLLSRVPLRPDSLSEVIHRGLKNSQAASCSETSRRCPTLPLAFHLLRATELSVKSFPRESREQCKRRRKQVGKRRKARGKYARNMLSPSRTALPSKRSRRRYA